MKKILFIATGGTIASEITADGLAPCFSPEQLIRHVPDLDKICNIDCVQLFSLDSTNIGPEHWIAIAKEIQRNYDTYDGFVISHGTDTMAYTAAALSYLIQRSPKPIILTGAQKPIDFDTTDSKANLYDAFICASSENMHGASIVFSGRVIVGTRACKTRSKSFDAFSSINYPHIADIRDGLLLQYIIPEFDLEPQFYEELNTNVGLLKLVPGMDRDILRLMLDRYDGLVIESFGVGGLPQNVGFHTAVREALQKGKTVVMTTQVQKEGSDLAVYHVGRRLTEDSGVLEAYDMTTEAALTKLMWILGKTRSVDMIRKLFYSAVNHDILTRKNK